MADLVAASGGSGITDSIAASGGSGITDTIAALRAVRSATARQLPGGLGAGLGQQPPVAGRDHGGTVRSAAVAEVFFTGNVWPQSLEFPGDNAVADQGWARCLRAFRTYDGIPHRHSSFSMDYAVPDNASWSSGDRSVMCVAYKQGVQVDYSIKRSKR